MLALILSLKTSGQNKRYVEEIALYHLDSLTKVDPVLKDFKYFTNGYLTNSRTSTDTTMWGLGSIKPNYNLRSSLKNLQIIEDTTISNFTVSRRIRKNGSSPTLKIFRFSKIEGKYLVEFIIALGEVGQTVLIIMNSYGDLIGRKYSVSIE
jgi:hypothetical protein